MSHDTAVELVRELLELQRVMQRVTRSEPGPRRLNPTSVALLHYLDRTGARRATTMAQDTGLGPSGLSRQLAGLQDAGLVARTPDPGDGRAALVAITAEGRRQLRAVLEQDAQRLAARLEDWDEDRARAGRAAVDEITAVFRDALGGERTTSCPRPADGPDGPPPGESAEDLPRTSTARGHEEETAR